MAVYDGLTRNQWPGTWSPSSNHPIVLDTEIRGALRFASGGAGDTLTDITGQRLQEGMLVYLKTGYGSFTSNTYYKYSLLSGESRDAATGAMPNAVGNWSVVTFAGASELSALSDVSTTTPSTGQVLKWDGTEWSPASDLSSGGGGGIALTDISVSQDSASGNGTLTYNNVTGVITYTPPVLFDGAYASLTGTPTIPTDITDLSITDGTSGQVLTTDGSGNFSFTTASGGASALGGLTDVSGSTPSAGQVLKWSGTQWEPASDSTGAGGSGIDLTDISVTIAGAAGGGSLTYNNSTGVFLFTPADVSSFSTFSGAYADLSGKPTLFSGNYNDLTNIPASSNNMELSLTGGTTLNLVNGTDNSVIDSVNLNAITSYLDYTQLDNLPTLFSGNYADLTNKPSIPNLTGYATESFVQTYVLSTITTDNLLEGGTNLFFNDERVDDRVAVLIDAGTGLTKTYDDAGNLLTIDLADTAVTAGSYGSGTEIPVITVDQQGRITSTTVATVSSDLPIAGDTGTDTVSLLTDTLTFTGGVGVTTTVATDAVTIDIGQAVGTTDDVTFNDVTVSGDLEVLGTLTSLNTTNTELKDNTIVLNQGEAGAGVTLGSAGIEIDRGTEANVSLLFEEADDQWSTGAIRLVTGDLHAGEEIRSSITSGSIVVNDRNLVLAGQTTDATTTEILLNDGTSTIDIASGATAKFKATVVCTDGTDTAAFNITGLIQNVAGTTSLIGTNILETIAEDSGSNWSADLTADDTDDYLKIEVTGEASKTIDWTVFLDISEVKR